MRTGRVLLLSRRLSDNGLEAYKLAKRRGYEGLVGKDLSSPYVERRSRYWLKVKVHQEDEFVIVGFTAPQGSRQHFGALLLGAPTRTGGFATSARLTPASTEKHWRLSTRNSSL